jgi:hypothetical protein
LSTARSELKRAAHYPPILALVELSRIDKTLSAFGPTLAALVSPFTGRVHADYLIAATSSAARQGVSRPVQGGGRPSAGRRRLFVDGIARHGAHYP